MKNKFYYVQLSKSQSKIALMCYDLICKRIKKTQTRNDMRFLQEYRWFIKNNQIKPANVARYILTPYWDIVGNMLATKILIKILKSKLQ